LIQQTLQGFILSKQQYTFSGQICLCYWLSSDYGPLKVVITGEEAVFFIEEKNQEKASGLLSKERISYKCKALPLSTFKQKKVVGFYFSQLKQFYQAREIFSQHFITTFESDIRHCDRFLMERYICGSVWIKGTVAQKNGYIEISNAKMKSLKDDTEYKPKLSMLSLDIECSGKGVLFSVGLYSEQCALVIMVGEAQKSTDIIWVKDETQLLTELERQIAFYDPDVIIGWNVINFDFSLLVNRAEQLDISLKLGRANNKVQLKQSQVGKLMVPGRVVLDGIDLMRNATYQFSSFSLANVSSEILGESKLIESDNRLEEIERQFVEDKTALAEYNLQDCKLVWDIFKKENLLEFAIVRTQLTGLDLERMGGSVAAFVNLYLPLLHRSGYVAPNLGDSPVSFDSPGGYVMSSSPGLYENVMVLDFKSLYPSIIRTFLIDPMGLIEGLNNDKYESAVPGFHDAKFSREQHHLPKLIEQLWSARDQAKKQKDKMLSQAIKIIMNSFYGVLGSTGCRFYDPRLSSSITLRGHEIMLQTKAWIEKAGYKVIYGDTDSTFIKLDDELTQNQCDEIGKLLADEINLKWQKKLHKEFNLLSHLEIEFETVYSPFFMPTIRGDIKGSKKRYVGQVIQQATDNKPEKKELIFKGMETVRSDWTLLARNFQSTLYRKVFDGEVVDEYIKNYVAKTLNGDFDHQLVYKKRLRQHLSEYLKNIPPHAQAALKVHITHPDKVPTKGQWVEYVISTNGPELKQFTTAKFNREHYVEKQIRPIAESILPYLNTTFDQILNGQASLF